MKVVEKGLGRREDEEREERKVMKEAWRRVAEAKHELGGVPRDVKGGEGRGKGKGGEGTVWKGKV